jgi:Ca-activated chloride channel homolog
MGHEAAVLKSIEDLTMSLLGVEARGKVDGLWFEVAVQQRYRNATATNIEAVYTFPVPWGAALLELDVQLGDKKLTAAVVEKRDAEAKYEEAIDKGDTAVMLERAADGLYTANLGNLMPGEEATIRYVYAQTLRYEQGSVRLTVPTVIAPKYGDPADAGFQPHQLPSSDLGVDYPFSLSIDLQGPLANGRIASPSHAIAVRATEDGASVELPGRAALDREFVLTIGGLASQSTAIVAKDGDGYVALGSFCVPVPASADESPLRLKILIDCSGSMAGDSIGAAKRALHRILASLQPSDRFSLSAFGSNVSHLVDQLTSASRSAVVDTAEKIHRIDANMGGTEMERALESVFVIGGSEGTADVLLISDGEIMAADSLVAEALRTRQRVFVVGIGSAPAEAVLRRLADATGGACEFVAPNEDVEAGILRMFSRLRSPRLERVDIAWPQTPRWTTSLPGGLFGGETIHVYAGFDALPTGNVIIELHAGDGDASLIGSAPLPSSVNNTPLLARMAALARIRDADAATQLRLALDYRLLTDRTNFLVVYVRSDEDKATDLPRLHKVAQMHAAGWAGLGSVTAKVAFNRIVVSECRTSLAGRLSQAQYCFDPDYDAGRPDSLQAQTSPVGGVTRVDWTKVLRALDAQYVASRLPTTLKELENLGVGGEVMRQMMSAHADGTPESVVVQAFLAALEPWAATAGVSRQLQRVLRQALRQAITHVGLYERIADCVGKPTPSIVVEP